MSDPAPDAREVLRRALLEIRGLKERLAAAERAARPAAAPIAVIGLGCRFAGAAEGPDAFWRLLASGRDPIGPRPADRWSGGEALPEGGFLADVEGFDAGCFGIAPREAAAMDPQHRLLLEVVWEALEHAALPPERLAGSATGVFVGLATHDWLRRVPEAAARDRYFGSGGSPAIAAGRIAYLLDLHGPCVTLDTACSSSLVAVHQAMRALREGECDTALAGGVALMLGPELGLSFRAAGMLAPDGRCKAFDARADGYGRGEGCAVLVLKRLPDAQRDGDPVLALLRGSAVNQDGRSAGLTAPNGPAQAALLRRALADAALAPGDIDYLEAHGTGTALGDPIEWHALAEVFAGRSRPLPVGSVKTNIGHTEAAAGAAGLVKAVLSVGRGEAPPGLHFTRLNPAITPGAPLAVARDMTPGVRRVGVSSFGFSGTNTHVVVEAPPPATETGAETGTDAGLLLLTAREPEALRALAGRYAAAFAEGLDFAAACRTAATGRARHRWWIAARSPAGLATATPSDAPPPALPPVTGPRLAGLPATPFRRKRFPLPSPPEVERRLAPGDEILAGTGGMAHLGVLLALLAALPGGLPAALENLAFPAPLRCTAPRRVRARREASQLLLESRPEGDDEGEGGSGWTVHLVAREAEPAANQKGGDAGLTAPSSPAQEAVRRAALAGVGPTPRAAAARPGALPGLSPPMPPAAPTPECAAALQARIEAAGFAYGPEARRIAALAVAGDQAVARLEGEGPGLAEAAAQLAYALLPPGAPPVMLARIARLRCRPGLATAAWMRARPSPEGGLLAEFGLAGADGAPLLEAEGAGFAPLPDHGPDWARLVRWRPAPPPAAMLEAAPEVWSPPEGADAAACCAALLGHLAGADQPLRIVTRGAQTTGQEAAAPDPAQAALWGLAQAVMAERPDLRCRLIDLDPDLPAATQRGLAEAEAWAADEPAVALRAGRRLARRFEPWPAAPDRPQRAALLAPGLIGWRDTPAADDGTPPPGMVRLRPVAAGLTFRDRLLLHGLAPPGATLGADGAGLVEAVGAGVAGLAPGDVVVVLAPGAIADALTVEAWRVAPAPCASLLDAATMPVPYCTALAGLPALTRGDRVLIHQAGSATGLAALAVARRAGAAVVATASRPRHPWFAPLGLAGLLDSRAPETWGEAADDVTIAFGAFEPALAARLTRGARVVNLDKRAPGHFDLDTLPPDRVQALLRRLPEWPPLPAQLIAREALAEALGAAAPAAPGRGVVVLRPAPPPRLRPGSLYLVTGAAGALGRLVAGWLAAQGARLCLVDRQPTAPLREGDVTLAADVADADAMAALLDRLEREGTPLAGVFHCAALVDDDLLAEQTPERLAAVLRAKLDGALLLDRLTRGRRLDAFVLFSSVVGLLPSARQGGYAAANAALDQIAAARRQRGLPGLSIAWGPWAAGIGARMGARAAAAWQGFGVTPIAPAAGLRALPGLLAAPAAQVLVADMDWDAASAGAGPAGATPAAPVAMSVARLQEVLAPLLGQRDPARLDPAAPLLSLGLDSLTAVEFARVLSRETGQRIPPDFAFRHPSLAAAAAALQAAPAAIPDPGPATRPGLAVARAALHVPVWEAAPETGEVAAGEAPEQAEAEAADLLDLSAFEAASGAGWDAWFAGLLPRLAARSGRPARILLALPAASPLAPAAEGFAAAARAEEPLWRLSVLRLEDAPDPARLRREWAAGARHVALGADGRHVRRLRRLPTPNRDWQAGPGTWLVTGGTGGVGALLAAHLAARGAEHLVLAARRPILPPALADLAARVTLRAADLAEEAAVAVLLEGLAADRALPTLRGILHAAGVVTDGRIAEAPWARLRGAFPAKLDGARWLDRHSRGLGLDHFVLCGSTAAWFGLPGTAGYAAANGALDAVVAERRAAGLPAQCIAWCAWEGAGMAADPALWAGGRAPSLPPAAACAGFDAALASGAPQVVVVNEGWPVEDRHAEDG